MRLSVDSEERAFMSAEEFWLSAYKYWPELPTAEQIFKFAEAYAQAKAQHEKATK